jgi:hypothetical protein
MAQEEKTCNWCLNADVELEHGSYIRLSCSELAVDSPDSLVEEAWEQENEDGLCPEFHLCKDDFDFNCQNCGGSGEGMADGSTCYKCRGSGVDTVIRRRDYPWV